jgi:hypothetical protein
MENVFINCPFDSAFERLFRAFVFAVQDCGFTPRCALEVDDGSEVRIDKIRRIIGESKFGIHDISRTEVDPVSGLPRFNMPLELGMFLGAKCFGGSAQRVKSCIIFDRERYRYQIFCSDIAGQDIRARHGDEAEAIRVVRDALATWRPGLRLPSGSVIHERYQRFLQWLPRFAEKAQLRTEELTFKDVTFLVSAWLAEEA